MAKQQEERRYVLEAEGTVYSATAAQAGDNGGGRPTAHPPGDVVCRIDRRDAFLLSPISREDMIQLARTDDETR